MMPARWLHHAVRLTGAASVPLLLALVPAGVVHGQTAVAPEDVAAIARSLNCPLCQGYNLQDCPLEVCAQMRETIRQKLEVGVTPDQIVADFVADYGPQVLSAPPRSGWMASAWLVPPIVLLLLALVGVWVLRPTAGPARVVAMTEPEPQPPAADSYVAEVERLAAQDDE